MDTTQIPMGTVVVGVDGSPASEQALDWAIAHASRERRPLTLAHGLDPAGAVRFDAAASNYDAVVDAMRHDGRELLQHARERVSRLAPDLAVHESLWQSDARVTLLKLAERAHLVVVGSRGRGPVASLLLGSVGVAVSRHASCPVVVVRPGHPGAVR
ncbi:MAG: universal stress protein, partial [Nocardioides sp.]